jgi:hypothetical protein
MNLIQLQIISGWTKHVHGYKPTTTTKLSTTSTSESHKNHLDSSIWITEVENLFTCIDIDCFRVKEFKISENFTASCFRHELLIRFELILPKTSKIDAFGYLRRNNQIGNYISPEKIGETPICKIIQR